jgi:hypothetical protein
MPSKHSATSPATKDLLLGAGLRLPVAVGGLGAGLHVIEVTASSPAYITLRVRLEDEMLPPLLVPLERNASRHYRRSFALSGAAREAWLEIMPESLSADAISVTLRRVRLWNLVALGTSAAMRHVRKPRTFLLKLRQVLARGGSFVFSSGNGGGIGDAAGYENWRQAFECERETRRIVTALEERIGRRPVRLLAVIGAWSHGRQALCQGLRSLAGATGVELHLLSLASPSWADGVGSQAIACSWQHHTCNPAGAIPMGVVADSVAQSRADLVVFLDRPGRFHDLAVTCLALGLAREPAAIAVYSDHDHLAPDGRRRDPVFKPASLSATRRGGLAALPLLQRFDALHGTRWRCRLPYPTYAIPCASIGRRGLRRARSI